MIAISVKNLQELVELDFASLKLATKTVLEGEGVPSAKVLRLLRRCHPSPN